MSVRAWPRGALLVGTFPTAFPIFGGTLHVLPAFLVPTTLLGIAGNTGEGQLEILLPLGAPPPPATFVIQSVFLDAPPPTTLSMSNGLKVVIG